VVNATDESGIEVSRRSVQENPKVTENTVGFENSIVFNLATIADTLPAWGGSQANVRLRDQQIRKFWPTEPILASTVFAMTLRNTTFSWKLTGPENTVAIVQQILHMSDLGRGWRSLISKVSTDLFTQDNGAFMEVIRQTDSPDSPVMNIAHLDAERCTRTGNLETPVLYRDTKGRTHDLKWYQVSTLEEFPSPVETMYSVQLCAVSRVLRAAQILRDIGVYQREKISGSNPNAIHITNSIGQRELEDAMVQHKATQAARGMTRYIVPLIVAGVDPTSPVSIETIDLKSLPDGFDVEIAMKWYINQLALGFGVDYQDLAPLPGGGLGTSNQSQILHEKSKGKGPGAFMQMMEYQFNFHGLIPQTITFEYDEQDTLEDKAQAELFDLESDAIKKNIESGALTPRAGTQLLLDKGFIGEEVFELVLEEMEATAAMATEDRQREIARDVTTDVMAQDDQPIQNKAMTDPYNMGVKEPAAFESLPEFGEELRIGQEEEFRALVLRALEDTLEDFEKRIGTKGRKRLRIGTKEDPNEVFLDGAFWAAFQERVEDIGQPFAQRVAKDAAALNVEVGLEVDMAFVNSKVLEFSETYTNVWWEQLEQSTRRSLQNAITTWQESGLGTRGLPDLVKSIEPIFGETRAELIAANEVTVVFDQGNNLAHIAAGIKTEEWQTSEDPAVEEICTALDGKRWPVDEGPRPVRDTHIGCRCARLPVGDDGKAIVR
jgi:SPP1 gp7 family putative phage head morphogenesis protein